MPLKIIGSGFGRTGTMSTKLALEELGFGPCHHMVEVMQNPAQPAFWADIAAGRAVDWDAVFDGYTAQVDWPGAAVWPQTMHAFPDAKIIHTERAENDWWGSFNTTIGKLFTRAPTMDLPPHIHEIFDTMEGLFLKSTFEDHTDRDCAIAAYRRNNAAVREQVRPIGCWSFRRRTAGARSANFSTCRCPTRRFRAAITGTNSGRISAVNLPEATASPIAYATRVHKVQSVRFRFCERSGNAARGPRAAPSARNVLKSSHSTAVANRRAARPASRTRAGAPRRASGAHSREYPSPPGI